MPQSTPLEKIESDDAPDAGGSDSERVQRIIQEMNRGGAESPGEPEPHQPMYQQQSNQQLPMHAQQQQQQQMPNPQMGYHMYQPPNMMPPQPMMGPGMVPYGQQPHYVQEHEVREEKHVVPAQAPVAPAKKNMWAHITDALKMPFVVACVFFILSLPVVDLYLSKYAHWAFSSGGQLSLAGIGIKAVVAATLIGLYDTIDNLISRFL